MAIDSWLEKEKPRHLSELFELLRIPSVSTDAAHAGDMQRAAEYVRGRFESAGLQARVCPTGGHDAVYAEWCKAPGAPTVLVYGHYDVQPPDPVELWRNPPFEPTVEGDSETGNIVARGATDDKGQFYCHVKGVEAHLATSGSLPVNVKFLIEGEEEIGSPNLRPFLEASKELLAADIVVVSDTSMFAPGRPSITVGLRGLAYMEVTVTGPSHDLHSGLFGGAVMNPINALAQMIASLHDDQGRVAVAGFYDTVRELSEAERAEYRALAHDDEAFRRELGIDEDSGEVGYSIHERVSARPTLDCNGIIGGYTGPGAKTVLPSVARSKISCRLVPDQDPDEVTALVSKHLLAAAPAGVTVEVEAHHGARPFLVDRSVPAIQAARAAMTRVWGAETVFTRGGGSIPVVGDFKDVLGLDTVLMGLGLKDDRLHSPNEKFGLENFYEGIRASAYLFEELGRRG